MTQHVTRGVCRSLNDLGYAVLTEFTLRNGRRVDVMGLGHDGVLLAAEEDGRVAYLLARAAHKIDRAIWPKRCGE